MKLEIRHQSHFGVGRVRFSPADFGVIACDAAADVDPQDPRPGAVWVVPKGTEVQYVRAQSWSCDYCGAAHALTKWKCDCCGGPRR